MIGRFPKMHQDWARKNVTLFRLTVPFLFQLAFVLLFLAAPCAWSEQSREDCNKCCERSFEDEYFRDQCQLKCFRNADHCLQEGAREQPRQPAQTQQLQGPQQTPQPRQVQPRPTQPVQDPRQMQPPQQIQPSRQVQQPGQPQQLPPPQQRPPAPPGEPRPAPGSVALRWPDPLNLTPGREADAAGQILQLNGIMPNHPRYPEALRAVEFVLVEFARQNPRGGQLPTTQLRNIVLKYKQ
ncbi:MAG: hypothetical protein AB1473_18605 [Thermodesulfobacteriota bacterium]